MCYNPAVPEFPRPRVGLNAHLLSLTATYRGAGINGYIYQLLRHLPDADATLAYTAYLYDRGFEPGAGLTVQRSNWDTRGPWRRIAWEQTRLAAATHGLDLLHGLAYATPLAATCRTIVSVHDLSFMRFPDAFRRANRLYLNLFTKLSARRAARVITGSESTRQDVIALCGVPADRVVTVPDGVTTAFCPADPREVAEFRQRKGLPKRFILFLGTLEPRKNVVRLLDAYAAWRRTSREPVVLVIAGGKGWFYETIFARALCAGRRTALVVPRCGVVCVSVTLRGLRLACAGGHGLRYADDYVQGILAPRGRRKCGAARRSRGHLRIDRRHRPRAIRPCVRC